MIDRVNSSMRELWNHRSHLSLFLLAWRSRRRLLEKRQRCRHPHRQAPTPDGGGYYREMATAPVARGIRFEKQCESSQRERTAPIAAASPSPSRLTRRREIHLFDDKTISQIKLLQKTATESAMSRDSRKVPMHCRARTSRHRASSPVRRSASQAISASSTATKSGHSVVFMGWEDEGWQMHRPEISQLARARPRALATRANISPTPASKTRRSIRNRRLLRSVQPPAGESPTGEPK